MKKGDSLLLSSGKEQISIASFGDYRLVSVQGLGQTDPKMAFSARVMADGEGYMGSFTGKRKIELCFEAAAGREQDVVRKELYAFFAPGRGGVLKVDRGDGVRSIGYVTGALSVPDVRAGQRLEAWVDLVCPDPWFRGQEIVLSLSTKEKLLTFPFLSLAERGVTSGMSERKTTVRPENPGQVEVGVVLTMRCVSGTVINPLIYCSSGKVHAQTTLRTGDVLVISTVRDDCYVRVNGQDAPIQRGSSFFHLAPGENLMLLSLLGGGKIEGTVKYTPCYVGA